MRCLIPGLAYYILGFLAWKACGQSPDERRIDYSNNFGDGQDKSLYQPREHATKYADPDTYSALVARGSNPNNEQRWVNFDNETYPIKFSGASEKKTVRQVNGEAPLYNIPLEQGLVQAKPQVRQVARTPDGSILVSGFNSRHSESPDSAPSRVLRKQGFPAGVSLEPKFVHVSQSSAGTFFVDGKKVQSLSAKEPSLGENGHTSTGEHGLWQTITENGENWEHAGQFLSAQAPVHAVGRDTNEAVWPLGAVEARGHNFDVHSMSTPSKGKHVQSKSISNSVESILNNNALSSALAGYSSDILALTAGVRVSIPWVGWGFNFCIGEPTD